MFDQLLETEPQKAEVKNRKGYFIASSVVIFSVLFGGLIISLFTIDLNLGMGEVDMMELIAPVELTEQKLPETEVAPRVPQKTAGGSSRMESRQVNMARIDESPSVVPTTVSTAKNTTKERPLTAKFEIGKFDSSESVGSGSGRGEGSGNGDGNGLGDGNDSEVAANTAAEELPPPPPVKKAPVVEKPVVRSMGVVNSLALSLPLPAIPAAAKVANVAGTVSVKVLVDEKGNVISASAVSGNILLREPSVEAAKNARFSPTLLSGTPVKISGVINYHFSS